MTDRFGIRPRRGAEAAALISEVEQLRETARALDRLLGQVVINRARPEIRQRARSFSADLRAAARRHDAGHHLDEAIACALDIARYLPLLGNRYATLVRARDSAQTRERALVDALRSRLAAAVAGITADLSDLDLSAFGRSSGELSRPGTGDLHRLRGVVWSTKTTWPRGLAPRVRVRSREIAAGVFLIEPGAPAEPAPIRLPRLESVDVELGWRLAEGTCVEIDLDAAAIGCGAGGNALGDDYHVFFNNERSPCGGIRQARAEQNANEDRIRISFRELDADVRKIVFVLTIYDADTRYLSFEQVEDPYVRLTGPDGAELAGHGPDSLSEGTSAVICSLRRHKKSWLFEPAAQEFPSGLVGVSREYGLSY
ncbi:TerD family protein [Amycolatopsis sp. NPDC048633]|uniref:TerD family protein n=1 Tax=Amycolatopsis sp. NPDC048633 TaxID=3157095 RepID=UPI00340F1D98